MDIINECFTNIGCYYIKHAPTGKFYVGSSKSCSRRIDYHFSRLRCGKHNNPDFQNLYNSDKNEYNYIRYIHLFNTREEAYVEEQRVLNENRNNTLLINRTYDAKCPILGIEGQKEIAKKRRDGQHRYWSDVSNKKKMSKKMKAEWQKPGRREKRTGGNNPFARRVEIDGVIYGSVMDASRTLKLNEKTIRIRANDERYSNYRWPDGARTHHKKLLEANKGSGLYSKKIMVDGVIYPTMKAAMKATKSSWDYLMRRAKDPDVKSVSIDPIDLATVRST